MTLVPNEPTPEGRELGAHLARMIAPEVARYRERHPDAPDLCGSCAFRAGTHPNGCPSSVMDALKCLMEGEAFYCHEVVNDDGSAVLPCQGWVAARLATPKDVGPAEMPWGYSSGEQ